MLPMASAMVGSWLTGSSWELDIVFEMGEDAELGEKGTTRVVPWSVYSGITLGSVSRVLPSWFNLGSSGLLSSGDENRCYMGQTVLMTVLASS